MGKIAPGLSRGLPRSSSDSSTIKEEVQEASACKKKREKKWVKKLTLRDFKIDGTLRCIHAPLSRGGRQEREREQAQPVTVTEGLVDTTTTAHQTPLIYTQKLGYKSLTMLIIKERTINYFTSKRGWHLVELYMYQVQQPKPQGKKSLDTLGSSMFHDDLAHWPRKQDSEGVNK